MKDNEFDTQERSSTPIIRASKRARVVVIVIWVFSALAGAAAIQWLLPYSEQYASKKEPQAVLRTMQILLAFLFLSVLPLGVYVFWFGFRAVRWRQMPPPGTWVIRTMRGVEGHRAQRRGRIAMALGVFLFAVGLFSAIYFPCRLGTVFHGRPSQPSVEPAKPTEVR